METLPVTQKWPARCAKVSDISDYWKKDLGLLPFMPTDNVQESDPPRLFGGFNGCAQRPAALQELEVPEDLDVSLRLLYLQPLGFSMDGAGTGVPHLLSLHSAHHSTWLNAFLGEIVFDLGFTWFYSVLDGVLYGKNRICDQENHRTHLLKQVFPNQNSEWPRKLGRWATSWRSSCGCVPGDDWGWMVRL